jgi:hypothetical protein
MSDLDPKLDRLLRSAATGDRDESPVVPFGFDTRVVALWRGSRTGNGNGLARLIRRVAFTAMTVIAIASAATFYEVRQERDADEQFGDEFAVADSAIQTEVY